MTYFATVFTNQLALSPIMFRNTASPIAILLVTTAFSGCSYDRSFMQLDSNSGVPFFGFQWAVDSGARPSKSATHDENDTLPSLIDLRTPSTLRAPDADRLKPDAERDDIRTVALNGDSRKTFPLPELGRWNEDLTVIREEVRSGPKSSYTSKAETVDATPIRAIVPKFESSNAASMFQNRRAAF